MDHRDLLSIACGEKNCARVLQLLGFTDINGVDNNGNSPLHRAITLDNINIFTLFVKNGADINAIGYDSKTPLHCAIIARRTEMISYLVAHADVTLTTKNQYTALHLVLWYQYKSPLEIVKQLLVAGADVNAKDNLGRSALQCVYIQNTEGGDNYWEDVVSHLLTAGANIDAQDSDGNTYLHYSFLNVNHVRFLLDHGASVEIRNNNGQTALDKAASNKAAGEPIVTLLLEHIASQNVKNAGRRK